MKAEKVFETKIGISLLKKIWKNYSIPPPQGRTFWKNKDVRYLWSGARTKFDRNDKDTVAEISFVGFAVYLSTKDMRFWTNKDGGTFEQFPDRNAA